MKTYPGLVVGDTTKSLPGPNTYVAGTNIIAAVVGTLCSEESSQKGVYRLSVQPKASKGPTLQIGSEVVCTVLRVENYFAAVRIEGT